MIGSPVSPETLGVQVSAAIPGPAAVADALAAGLVAVAETVGLVTDVAVLLCVGSSDTVVAGLDGVAVADVTGPAGLTVPQPVSMTAARPTRHKDNGLITDGFWHSRRNAPRD